jgi:hypothetical protein
MSELTDEEIGGYYDRTQAEWLREIPEEHQAFQRTKYIRDVRANPEALRQLREHLDRESDR